MENASGCSLSDSVITAINTSGNGANGIKLKNATDNNFSSIAISDITSPNGNARGVIMTTSNGNSFISTAVSDIEARAVFGFYMGESDENSFESTTLSNFMAYQVLGFYIFSGSSSNSFSDTEISYLTGDYSAVGIELYASSNTFISTEISHITAEESHAVGVLVDCNICDNSFFEYDISGSGCSATIVVGIYISAEANSNSFTSGSITGEQYGVSTKCSANSIHLSNISGNSIYGVKNSDVGASFDATNNWWGAANGPTHASNPDGTGNAVSDNVAFIPFLLPNVTLTKTGPSTANQGNDITYTITYKNEGTFDATNIIVTETYPSEVSYVSAIPEPDTGTNNQWTIGTLAPDEEKTITVIVHIK
jgi:uncharacterized repeat protein (TIGR01451 family)